MQPKRIVLLTLFISMTALCQDSGRNTVSVGVGGGFPAGGENVFVTYGLPDSAAFSAAYEFRLFKYFAPEVGVVNLIPNIASYSGHGQTTFSRERVTLISFGGRGIAPLMGGRIELFAGAGGVHVSSSGALLIGYGATSWLAQVDGGGRIAIDKRRHFWLGPTVRFSRNVSRPTQEWVSLTAGFGFRF
jgi:hypothetical protein